MNGSIIKLSLADDYEGKVEATIIRTMADNSAKAVIYIHGYVDYFFQNHVAEAFNNQGWNFYALDLRKYGRSMLPHQRPYYCRDLKEYFPEIDRTIQQACNDGNSTIVLMGHSTGGLISSIYAADGAEKDKLKAFIFNSPFFEFNTSWFKKLMAVSFSTLISRIIPYARKRGELSEHYTASIHSSMRGEWDFDLKLKPATGVPLYFAWLSAVRRAQKEMRRGLHIKLPILVLHSDKSYNGLKWNDQYLESDGVLNVNHIIRYAPCLGNNVTDIKISGALHDVLLSRYPVRTEALNIIFSWLESVVVSSSLHSESAI